MPNPTVRSLLATSFLAGELATEDVVARAAVTLGHSWRWLRPLARRFVTEFAGGTRPRHRDAVRFLENDEEFRRACVRHKKTLTVGRWLPDQQRMQPATAAASWELPAIESVGALAEWLQVDIADVEWFADLRGLARGIKLEHYHYRVLAKDSTSIRFIEAPKPRLKRLQKRILEEILDRIPPHAAAHGFRKGRSILSFAAPHSAQRVVLKMDLRDFFPSISGARVQALFRTAGYPESVADVLGGICTNAVARGAWPPFAREMDPRSCYEARERYARPHVPQGAPTSPAIANLCAYRADCRLAGLAAAVGATYTRYADDLAFSGGPEFERRVERFGVHAAAILEEEGFAVHHRKTRIMRQGVRQRVAGVVVNQNVNVIRGDYDRLKATLTNCVRLGPESQNREAHPRFQAHLLGKISFVEMVNPVKGNRLRALFHEIQWPA